MKDENLLVRKTRENVNYVYRYMIRSEVCDPANPRSTVLLDCTQKYRYRILSK